MPSLVARHCKSSSGSVSQLLGKDPLLVLLLAKQALSLVKSIVRPLLFEGTMIKHFSCPFVSGALKVISQKISPDQVNQGCLCST